MAIIWTLSIDGGIRLQLKDGYGIQSAVVTKAAFDIGTLTLRIPVDDISVGTPFTYGQSVTLYRDSTVWFIGRVRKVIATFGGSQENWTITICDSWWEMEHTVYRQPAVVTKNDFTGFVGYMSSRITLNQDAWGVGIPQDQQIANAIGYAQGQAPGIIALAAAPSLPTWPREETREITVAEAVRRSSSLAPASFMSADYSTGIFSVTLASVGALSLVTLDLNAGDKIVEVSGLHRRDDLIPPGVVFDFWTTQTDGAGKSYSKLTRQSAGSPGSPGSIYGSFNLGPCDTIPAGAAAAYYNALNVAQWEGSLTLAEQESSGLIAPGARIRLINGFAAWATMDAVVQRTTEDLFSGRMTVDMGPNAALGADDFVGNLNRIRNRPAPTAFCNVQHNGTSGVATGIDDNGNPTSVPPGGAGATAGVNGPASGSKPGVGSPTGNASSGAPASSAAGAGGVAGPFDTAELTLCNGTTIKVVTAKP